MLALHLVNGDAPHPLLHADADAAGAAAAGHAAAAGRRISLLVTFAPAPAPGERRAGDAFRAHPLRVIEAQAAALALPHVVCQVGPPSYLDSYAAALRALRDERGVTGLVTGDIEDVAGGFMAAAAKAAGVDLVTPLWRAPRDAILGALFDLGIDATISCVALAKFAAPDDASAAAGGQGGDGAKQQQQQQPEAATAAAGEGGGGKSDAQQSCSSCHCIAPLARPLGPPLFDAVGRLLGRWLTRALTAGALREAAAAAGIDPAGEDGAFHTIVTRCPLMRGAAVELEGRPRADDGTPYAYMVWERVRVAPSGSGGGGGG